MNVPTLNFRPSLLQLTYLIHIRTAFNWSFAILSSFQAFLKLILQVLWGGYY